MPRSGCRFAAGVCDGWTEPDTDPTLPCPSCWDAFQTGDVFRRGDEEYVVTHRVEGRLSTGVKVWCGWARVKPAP